MATKKQAPTKSAKNAAAELKGETQATVVSSPISSMLPSGFKIKRVVTVPALVLKEIGVGRPLMIVDAIRVSTVEGKKDKDGKPQKPADVCTVTDLSTGEQFLFLVPSVVKANLERDYKDETYVGKAFYIQNLGKRSTTQRYNDFGIAEIEAEEA